MEKFLNDRQLHEFFFPLVCQLANNMLTYLNVHLMEYEEHHSILQHL